MKRHSALVPLSREHRFSLELCEALKLDATAEQRRRFPPSSAGQRDALALLARVHILPHLVNEEQLFEAHVRGRSPTVDALLAQMRAEHRALRADLARLRDCAEPTPDELDSFARRFERHLQFEENELYPAVETLPGPTLDQLARALAVSAEHPSLRPEPG